MFSIISYCQVMSVGIITTTTVMFVMVKEDMFVQIFEHILHGTNIQMEQRNDS